jgi:hypothetical protein
MKMPDALGANGNGMYWYTDPNSAITDHPIYQTYSVQAIGAIDMNTITNDLNAMVGSAESSPIVNYLWWLIQVKKEAA